MNKSEYFEALDFSLVLGGRSSSFSVWPISPITRDVILRYRSGYTGAGGAVGAHHDAAEKTAEKGDRHRILRTVREGLHQDVNLRLYGPVGPVPVICPDAVASALSNCLAHLRRQG
jgi:hypothetical protein